MYHLVNGRLLPGDQGHGGTQDQPGVPGCGDGMFHHGGCSKIPGETIWAAAVQRGYSGGKWGVWRQELVWELIGKRADLLDHPGGPGKDLEEMFPIHIVYIGSRNFQKSDSAFLFKIFRYRWRGGQEDAPVNGNDFSNTLQSNLLEKLVSLKKMTYTYPEWKP